MNNLEKLYTKNIKTYSKKYIDYLHHVMNQINFDEIDNVLKIFLKAQKNNSNVFFIGNGGSASTASHFANDLSFGTKKIDKALKCIALTDNVSIITALGNDYSYDEIFQKQLMVLGNSNDVLVGISASGNSKNLINAFEYAVKNNIETIALTSFDGGALKKISDNTIHVPFEIGEYGPAEDAHLILNHIIISYLVQYFINEQK